MDAGIHQFVQQQAFLPFYEREQVECPFIEAFGEPFNEAFSVQPAQVPEDVHPNNRLSYRMRTYRLCQKTSMKRFSGFRIYPL
jgi:hypothetical protein